MQSSIKALVVALALAWPALAMAQQHGQHGKPAPAAGHGHGQHHGATAAAAGPAQKAYEAINDRMHKEMGIAYSGNPDIDFVRGMIPHHQGAVDMAKTVIAFGKDPEIRKLAEGIIKAQEDEIAQLKAWLEKNAK